MELNFEECVKNLSDKNNTNYMFDVEYINKILQQGYEVFYNNKKIIKLKYWDYCGCPEISALYEEEKGFNVGTGWLLDLKEHLQTTNKA